LSAFQIPWNPTRSTLRQFAGLWLAAVGLVAYRTGLFTGHASTLSMTLLAVAALCGIVGLAWPPSIRPLFVGLMIATTPIGWVVSHVLLTIVYWGLFTPVGFLFKLMGRDSLDRRFQPELTTYWQPKTMPTDPSRYLRTF
jgi:hypothetical protein